MSVKTFRSLDDEAAQSLWREPGDPRVWDGVANHNSSLAGEPRGSDLARRRMSPDSCSVEVTRGDVPPKHHGG